MYCIRRQLSSSISTLKDDCIGLISASYSYYDAIFEGLNAVFVMHTFYRNKIHMPTVHRSNLVKRVFWINKVLFEIKNIQSITNIVTKHKISFR